MRRVTIIGPGRLGGALALALDGTEYAASQLVYRTRSIAETLAAGLSVAPKLASAFDSLGSRSEVVIICVPDPGIVQICSELTGSVQPDTVVLHTSGSLASSVLQPLKDVGCSIGSMHPLAAVSESATGATLLRGSYFCVEGDEAAASTAEAIARTLGATPFKIAAEFKALYHAAAVTSAGHAIALFDVALEMLAACGLSRELSREILLPLVSGALANLATQDTPNALTGPYARHDLETIDRHFQSFRNAISGNAVAVYLALAERSVNVAEAGAPISPEMEEIRKRISVAKRNHEW